MNKWFDIGQKCYCFHLHSEVALIPTDFHRGGNVKFSHCALVYGVSAQV